MHLVYIYFYLVSSTSSDDVLLDELIRTKKAWIVRPHKSVYRPGAIFKKIEEYEWPREKVLLFLVLNKLHNLEINIGDEIRYNTFEFVNKSNIIEFTKEFETAINSLKLITKNAILYNDWNYKNNPAFEVVNEIEKSLEEYVKNDKTRKLFNRYKTDIAPVSFIEEVFYLLSNCSYDGWTRLEYEILLNLDKMEVWVINKIYFLNYFTRDIEAFKNLLLIVYNEIRKFVPSVSIYDVICYNWSAFLLDIGIGYTYIHSKQISPHCKLTEIWKTYTGKNFKYFFDFLTNITNRLYDKLEHHVPNHHVKISEGKRPDEVMFNMTDKNLQLSFIGLCGRHIRKQMVRPDFDVQDLKYVALKSKYLLDYSWKDMNKIKKLILDILDKKCKDRKFVLKMRAKYEGHMLKTLIN